MAASDDFFGKIYWPQLREQKLALIEALDAGADPRLEGVLNLLDALQDYAVDVLGVPEEGCFYPRKMTSPCVRDARATSPAT